MLIDALSRVFCAQRSRPVLWPLVRQERQALERRDVPYFALPTHATDVPNGDHALTGYVVTSGVDAVRERIAGLDDIDFARQSALLETVLHDPPRFLSDTQPPNRWPAETAAAPVDFVVAARDIGRMLTDRAEARDRRDETWLRPAGHDGPLSLHLYDGAAGIALFLSALAHQTGEDRFQASAHAALAPIADVLGNEDDGRLGSALGAGHGLGGMVYALTLASRWLAEPALLGLAQRIAQRIDPEAIAADEQLDLEAGSAGAILGLLTLHAVDANTAWLSRATDCADHLLSQPSVTAACAGGPARLGPGMAHGAAGMAYALDRLAAAGGRPGDRAAATQLFDYAAQGGRRIPPQDGRWCNGHAGLALACTLATDLGSTVVDFYLQKGIGSLASNSTDYCCGAMGRIDCVLEAAEHRGDPWLQQLARETAGRVVASGQRPDGYRLVDGASATRYQPQLFSGVAGIGYGLLRLAAPRAFPSVLAFRPPTSDS